MKLRFMSSLLALALLFSITACAAGQTVESTAPAAGAWYAEAVEYVRTNGLMDDVSAGAFEPNAPATRAELVDALYRAAGSPAVTAHGDFTDVPGESPYADAVAWAASVGLVTGYTGGRFGPGDTVTREQFAAILWRQAGTPAPAGGVQDFSDHASISPYAVSAVAWAREAGLFSGKENGAFDPAGETTRAETATILYRLAQGATPPAESESRILVAYFSRTGTTEGVARTMAELTGGDLFELVPETAYPTDYSACLEQASRELSADALPTLSSHVEDMSRYDVILLGFPIWHGDAPMAVRTFLEEYDLTGKTVAPFSTSGSSGIGAAMASIRALCPGAAVADGLSIPSASLDQANAMAADWVSGLNLNTEKTAMRIQIQSGEAAVVYELNGSAAAKALYAQLPLTIQVENYSTNEKIFYPPEKLDTADTPLAENQTGSLAYFAPWGDVVLFYGPFSANSGLYSLGRAISGVEHISSLSGTIAISVLQ